MATPEKSEGEIGRGEGRRTSVYWSGKRTERLFLSNQRRRVLSLSKSRARGKEGKGKDGRRSEQGFILFLAKDISDEPLARGQECMCTRRMRTRTTHRMQQEREEEGEKRREGGGIQDRRERAAALSLA